MFRDFPDVLTVPQVAQALGIGIKAAYSLVNNHQIGAIRVGRTIKVPKFSLEEFYTNSSKQSKVVTVNAIAVLERSTLYDR